MNSSNRLSVAYVESFLKSLLPSAKVEKLPEYTFRIFVSDSAVEIKIDRALMDDFEAAIEKQLDTNYSHAILNRVKFQFFIGLGKRGLLPDTSISTELLNERGDWLKNKKIDVAFDHDLCNDLCRGLGLLSGSLNRILSRGPKLPDIESEKAIVDNLEIYYAEKGNLATKGAGAESLSYLKAALVCVILEKERIKLSEKIPRVRSAMDREIYRIVESIRSEPFHDVRLPEAMYDYVRQNDETIIDSQKFVEKPEGKMESISGKMYRVQVAGPSDVQVECNEIRNAISQWTSIHGAQKDVFLVPVDWKHNTAPFLAKRTQAVINEQVTASADVLIAVFWTRIGTSTGEAVSGTVEEIEELVRAGKPVLIYMSQARQQPASIDATQFAALEEFKKKIQPMGLIHFYSTPEELKGQLQTALTLMVDQHPYFRREGSTKVVAPISERTAPIVVAIPPRSQNKTEISPDAARLLTAAAKDQHGVIIHFETMSGLVISTGGIDFAKEVTGREAAKWEDVLGELERSGFVKAASYKRDVFKVTATGYSVAEELEQ